MTEIVCIYLYVSCTICFCKLPNIHRCTFCLLATHLPAGCSCRVLYLNIILILCNGSLVDNGVGSAGACALANIIKNSTSLEELWYVLETSYTCTDNAHDICAN